MQLKIRLTRDHVVHSIQVDSSMSVVDLCQRIEQSLPIQHEHDASEYGLFFKDQQQATRSYWLEPARVLSYYLLKNDDELEYKNRYRPLKIRLLDGTVKIILIDDSLIVAQLMVYICTKFGIANYDEYLLVYDSDLNSKSSTLRRDRSLQRTDKKMEELKKKCHTDDDTLWLDQSKTLRQQEIDEQSTVVLRRKYFFSDTNIDQRDPVQLNLLYVQCRNGIIDGTHPITLDEAIQFSGLQCQIEFADYQESKHKSDLLDLKEFLPKEYIKTKAIEKRILTEHKKHLGLAEIDAKVKYTQLCRSLRTYGVTFFLVKEKLSGKNKLVPRLLGVTKESIVRVDERSKDFLEVWPLTHVKRWTASPNTFTLDFGDYASAYYSVQTHEGQQISQLIAGYIDIILKKRKDRDDVDRKDIGDEEATVIEDIIAPGKATVIQPNRPSFGFAQQHPVHSPPLIRGTLSDTLQYDNGPYRPNIPILDQQEFSSSSSDSYLNPSTAMLLSTMANARNGLHAILHQLQMDHRSHNPSPNWSLDMSRQLFTSELSAMNACTAQIIILTSDIHHQADEIHSSLATVISTMTANLHEFAQEIHRYGNAIPDSPILLDQTCRICTIFEDLLVFIQSLVKNRSDPTSKQNVLLIASRLGEINQDLVRRLTNYMDCSIEYQDKLLALAKSVASTAASYVLKAKDIANNVTEQTIVNDIISTATQCALATSQLVACTKIVVATISSPLCQEQLIESARNVTRSIESVLQACSPPRTTDVFYSELIDASRTVRQTLHEFLLHIKLITDRTAAHSDRLFSPIFASLKSLSPARRIILSEQLTEVKEEEEANDDEIKTTSPEQSIDQIFLASDRLFSSMGDPTEMVKQAKILAQSTAELVSSLRHQAESIDDDTNQQKKFLAAAKMLADATAKLVEAAKYCANKPNDHQHQNHLKFAVEELRSATHLAMNQQNQRKIFQRIEQCAKHSASCATQCIAATSACTMTNRNQQAQQQLIQQCKIVADLIPKVVQAIRMLMIQPDCWAYQMHLLFISEDFLRPANDLADSAHSVIRTIDDQSEVLHLNQSSKQLSQALIDLRSCLSRGHELCAVIPIDIDSAIQLIEILDREFNDIQRQLKSGPLKGVFDEHVDPALMYQQLHSLVSQLLETSQNNERAVEQVLRSLLPHLRQWIQIVRSNVAHCSDEHRQQSILERSRHLLQLILSILNEIKRKFQTNVDSYHQKNLSDLVEEFFSCLDRCFDVKPSQQHYFDAAMKQISEYVYRLAGPFDRKGSSSSSSLSVNSDNLNRAADQLNRATTDLVMSTHQGDLGQTSTRFSQAFGDFLHQSLDFVHHQNEDEKRSHLLITLKNVHTSSNQFLERARSVSLEPIKTDYDAKQQLANAARAVTETIQEVISACLLTSTTSNMTVGRLECDQAIREMEQSQVLLEQSKQRPCADYNYFEALDHVVDNSKRLGEAMTHIASASKNTNHSLYLQAIHDTSSAVCHLVEAAAQASYLIGIAQVKSASSIIDQNLLNRSVIGIRKACSDLSNSSIDRHDILALATTIAKHTSALCNLSRDASSYTGDASVRRHFVQSAKEVANSTADLVRTIKVLDGSYTSENHQSCIETSQPLLRAVNELDILMKSKDAANGSSVVCSSQEAILVATRNVVDGACRIVECSKVLIINSREPSLWQQLATHTKHVSEAIKRLATLVKEMTPGQKECDKAMEQLRILFQKVDQALMHVQTLPKKDQSAQYYQEEIISNGQSLLDLIDRLRQSSKSHCERLGSDVSKMIVYIEGCIHHTIDYVSYRIDVHERIQFLEQSKAVVEISLQLILSCKESGGNEKNHQWYRMLDHHSDQFRHVVEKLLRKFQDSTADIRQWISILNTPMTKHQGHFNDYQIRLVDSLRQIIRTLQDIIVIKTDHQSQLRRLTEQYEDLIHSTHGAMHTDIGQDLALQLKQGVTDLGSSIIELIEQATEKKSSTTVKILTEKVIEKISHLLTLLQVNLRGAQACLHASNTVSGLIADLDTTIVFATNKSFSSKKQGETFANHRESILKTAKELVEDTKTLVAGAASSQEQLATAAQAAVRTITKLVDAVKLGAASFDAQDGQIQVMLINSVKDVALALNNLINVTKAASGKTIDHPEMKKLKESAKVMVTNVTSLLRTVKAVEEKVQHGNDILTMTIQSIDEQLQHSHQSDTSIQQSTPEDLIRVTKQMTLATSKAVGAGQTGRQEDMISAANLGRQASHDLLSICKASQYQISDQQFQQRILENGRNCVKSYQDFLRTIHHLLEQPTNELKQELIQYSKNIAQTVQELVHCAEQWKKMDFIDSDDPTYLAEHELLHAAQSIESAAKKLAVLKPRRPVQNINENLNFDEQILDAAKSIMNATSTLINAATSAQKELVQQGKLSSNSSSDDDGQWSEGLISAARYVASACHVLCDAANGLVQGSESEEKLISCAKQVNSTTAALLVACKVKADFMSPSMTRLQVAGQCVKRATDGLVRAAQQAVELHKEEKQIEIPTRLVPGIAQEIKCKEMILTKERELDEARYRLKTIRLAKYGHTESESYEST